MLLHPEKEEQFLLYISSWEKKFFLRSLLEDLPSFAWIPQNRVWESQSKILKSRVRETKNKSTEVTRINNNEEFCVMMTLVFQCIRHSLLHSFSVNVYTHVVCELIHSFHSLVHKFNMSWTSTMLDAVIQRQMWLPVSYPLSLLPHLSNSDFCSISSPTLLTTVLCPLPFSWPGKLILPQLNTVLSAALLAWVTDCCWIKLCKPRISFSANI